MVAQAKQPPLKGYVLQGQGKRYWCPDLLTAQAIEIRLKKETGWEPTNRTIEKRVGKEWVQVGTWDPATGHELLYGQGIR